jgi:hypothetical protein
MELGMKVERKLSDFSAEKLKWHENMKTEMEIRGTETKGGSESGNGTVFSARTDAQTEVSISG